MSKGVSYYTSTDSNKVINIPGSKDMIGKIMKIEITELNNKSLKGDLLVS